MSRQDISCFRQLHGRLDGVLRAAWFRGGSRTLHDGDRARAVRIAGLGDHYARRPEQLAKEHVGYGNSCTHDLLSWGFRAGPPVGHDVHGTGLPAGVKSVVVSGILPSWRSADPCDECFRFRGRGVCAGGRSPVPSLGELRRRKGKVSVVIKPVDVWRSGCLGVARLSRKGSKYRALANSVDAVRTPRHVRDRSCTVNLRS